MNETLESRNSVSVSYWLRDRRSTFGTVYTVSRFFTVDPHEDMMDIAGLFT
jgi:hypothetical protein